MSQKIGLTTHKKTIQEPRGHHQRQERLGQPIPVTTSLRQRRSGLNCIQTVRLHTKTSRTQLQTEIHSHSNCYKLSHERFHRLIKQQRFEPLNWPKESRATVAQPHLPFSFDNSASTLTLRQFVSGGCHLISVLPLTSKLDFEFIDL